MPRLASRITLEIVSVRVEGVQEITEEASKAEGIPMKHIVVPWGKAESFGDCFHESFFHASYRSAFECLWDSINAKRGFGWDKNPRVWVIEFKRLDVSKEGKLAPRKEPNEK